MERAVFFLKGMHQVAQYVCKKLLSMVVISWESVVYILSDYNRTSELRTPQLRTVQLTKRSVEQLFGKYHQNFYKKGKG